MSVVGEQEALTEIKAMFESLYVKYNSNETLKNRLLYYLLKYVPEKMEEHTQNLIEKEHRTEILSEEHTKFVQTFMNNTEREYFYIPVSQLFVCYNGEEYTKINEDDILHDVLTRIKTNPQLTAWKYRIKSNVMKLIKEQYVLDHIPSSKTIQDILTLLSATFKLGKDEAKYFLTIIGDNMLKICSGLVYFADVKTKSFFQNVSDFSYSYFKSSRNPVDCIKFKYYHHDFSKCRLLHLPHYVEHAACRDYLKKHILDFLCVACHYSKRFQCADNFLRNQAGGTVFAEYALTLHNTTIDAILEQFRSEYLEQSVTTMKFTLSSGEMYFLWKSFLTNHKLPLLLFSKQFEEQMNNVYGELKEGDIYQNITSREIGYVKTFNQFWKESITYDSTEQYFEISELRDILSKEQRLNLEEDKILSLLRHFHPDVEIEDDKFVNGIACTFWNKKQDIDNFLNACQNNTSYTNYCSYTNNKGLPYNVSKLYFERLITSDGCV